MKYVILVANILIGLVFVVFGLNGFLHFIPMPTPTEPGFMKEMMDSGFIYVIKVIEIICGAMILFNFQRPLAYIILFPIVIGILLTEIFIMKQPSIGVALIGLLSLLIYSNREKYMGILN